MIDIESQVFTPLAEDLRAAFPGITVSGEYVRAPSSFPFVSIVEEDNFMTAARMDTGDAERFSGLMYEVNVYSNKSVGKKSECKEIIALIDALLYKLNFTRISLAPVPNLENASIYRMTARYRAETDGTNIYRR